MKKIIIMFLMFPIIFLTVSCGIKKEEIKQGENQPETIEEIVENKTEAKQGDIELSNVTISANGSMNIVNAVLKNSGKKTKSFKAVLYMKNELGFILGKLEKDIEKLEPNASDEISIEIMGDYSTVSEYQLIVENLLDH